MTITITSLGKRLAKGAFSQVYTLAADPEVVVKVFKEYEYFLEVEFQAQQIAYACGLAPKPLSYGWIEGKDEDYQYLCMERVFPYEGAITEDLKQDLLDRLKAFHQAGWVHGDIKRCLDPYGSKGAWDNLILANTGFLLLDYGRARHGPEFRNYQLYELSQLAEFFSFY